MASKWLDQFLKRSCWLAGVASKVLWYGLTLLDHALLSEGLGPHDSISGITAAQQAHLLQAIQGAEQMLDHFYKEPPKGYIWQIRQGDLNLPQPPICLCDLWPSTSSGHFSYFCLWSVCAGMIRFV